MVLVSVQDASFSYGREMVFDRVSFDVGPGEIFCLLGPNGCGKTTLLDCVLGLHRLESGRIRVMGKDTRHIRSGRIARTIAYVPQSHEQSFPYTVKQIATMGRAAYLGLFEAPSPGDVSLAETALDRIGISHLTDRPYTQLSGGETQLVMIARALVQQTPVMILDEPTCHLDFRYELAILEVIVDLVREDRLSIIMATHFPNHAFYFDSHGIKTRVALLHKKGFLAAGPPGAILDEDRLRRLYGVNTSVISVGGNGTPALRQVVPLGTAEGPVCGSSTEPIGPARTRESGMQE